MTPSSKYIAKTRTSPDIPSNSARSIVKVNSSITHSNNFNHKINSGEQMSNKKALRKPQESENNLIKEGDMITLNAVESAILLYGRQHPMIGNPYQYFSQVCGYKSKNTLYFIFQKRENYKLTLDTIKKIHSITKDNQIVEALLKEVSK